MEAKKYKQHGILVGLAVWGLAGSALADPQAGREAYEAPSAGVQRVILSTAVVNNSSHLGIGGYVEDFEQTWLDGTGTLFGGQYETGWPYGTSFTFCGGPDANNGSYSCASPNTGVPGQGTAESYVYQRSGIVGSTSTWYAQVWQSGLVYTFGNWVLNGVNSTYAQPYVMSGGSLGIPLTNQAPWLGFWYVDGNNGSYWYGSDWANDSSQAYGNGRYTGVDGGTVANGGQSSGQIVCSSGQC